MAPAMFSASSGERNDIYLAIVSLGLLLLTCVDAQPVRQIAVLAWGASFGLLALSNIGAAMGVYVSAVALYSNLYFRGMLSLFERPDHSALVILLLVLGFSQFKSRSWSIGWLGLTTVAFLLYGVGNGFLTGTFSMGSVAVFGRTYGIPFVLILLLLNAGPTLKDFRSFVLVLLIVGGYSALVSWLWQTGPRELIFPTWINNPMTNSWYGGSRSGGILMQPAANGLFLSLVFCLLWLAHQRWLTGYSRILLLGVGASFLGAVYFTFTRAAYLGILLAVIGLSWSRTGDTRRTMLKRIFLSSIAVISVVLAMLAAPENLETRVGNQSTVVWRLEIWKIALNMIPERPLLGFGLRGFNTNVAEFYGGGTVLTQQGLESARPAVHNLFLNLLVELGLVGFSLFVALVWLLYRKAAATCRVSWGGRGAFWVAIFMGVYFLQAQFGVPQQPAPNLVLYGALGLLAGISQTALLRSEHYRRWSLDARPVPLVAER